MNFTLSKCEALAMEQNSYSFRPLENCRSADFAKIPFLGAFPAPEKSPAHSPEQPRQPGLDGMRAIAVIAVLLFHGGIGWLPGGFLGVDVFFVLSGYLITGILIREQASAQTIRLKAFYLRRARRLLPALVAMLLVTVTCAALFMKDVVKTTAEDLPWALAGLSNWWFVFHHQSYFEAIGRPPLFRHTWSLAVEAQFYLVWPFLICFAYRAFGISGIRRIAIACGVLSVSTLLLVSMSVNAGVGTASSHVYFGTDTHSVGLFLGAALATFRWSVRPRAEARTGVSRLVPDVLGVLALAALVFLCHAVDDSIARYRIGLPAASVCSAILIAVTTLPGSIVGSYLGARPMTWIGERSYSIYVWHWPIFQATRPGIDVSVSGLVDLALRLALTLGIAELSYRYVEMPVRNGVLRRWRSIGSSWDVKTRRFAAAAMITVASVVIVGEATLISRAIHAEPNRVVVVPVQSSASSAVAGSSTASSVSGPGGLSRQELSQKSVSPSNIEALSRAESAEVLRLPAMLLGDSVLLGVSQWIARQVNVVKVDAVVGRQAGELRKIIERMAEAGELEPVVIVNLGNNGVVDEATLRAILNDLKTCQRVIVVNTRVPRRWQDDNDALMARVVPDYPNAVLADWRAASEGHTEYFGQDGVHAGTAGAKAYADLVVYALASTGSARP